MHQFIIHSLPRLKEGSFTSQTSKSSRNSQLTTKPFHGHPLGMIECEQIVREPLIAPESCAIIDSNLPDPLKTQQNHEILRTRQQIEITQMSNETWLIDEHSADAQSILLEKNVTVITVMPTPNLETKATQTLELHFNFGVDRFFLIGMPCKLMLEGALRLHSPSVDLVFGINLLSVTGNTMIYVNDHVIDVYAKMEYFEHVNDRRRLAFDFYGKLPQFDVAQNNSGADSGNHPEYVLYFTMNQRRRAVGLYIGPMMPATANAFKPLNVSIYKTKKGDQLDPSRLDVMLVMNDACCKDRRTIMAHSQLAIVSVAGSATLHVCTLYKLCFSFSGPGHSIKIAGYLAIRTSLGNQLVPGRSEVIIKAGAPRIYIDDHFAVLVIDSDDIEYEVEQWHKQKELRSISIMNTNKLLQQRSNQGSLRKTRK